MPVILNSGPDVSASANAQGMQGVQVAGLAGGGYVTTWYENGTTVYARIYGADNRPVTPAFVVSGAVPNSGNPVVTGLDDGTFVIAWTGTGNGSDIFGRHFDSDGTAMTDPFVVNASLGVVGEQSAPSITSLGATFAVSWKSQGASGGILTANFLPDGTFLGSHGRVTDAFFDQSRAGLAGRADGTLGVITVGDPLGGANYQVYADIGVANFGAGGIHHRIQVSDAADGIASSIVSADMAELEDGSFIAVWAQGATADVYYRHIAGDGTFLGGPVRLTTTTPVLSAKVVALADGGFEIAWSTNAAQASVLGQRFDADGDAVTPATVLDVGDANHVYFLSDMTALGDGGFVLSGSYSLAGHVLGFQKAFFGAPSLLGTQYVYGSADPDLMDGGAGADRMYGGMGDDTYIVNSAGDTIFDTGGRDTVMSGITLNLASGLETLILTGHGNINGFGNDSGNIITGNDGNNTLFGGAGGDVMRGGEGDDLIVTYAGADYADGGNGNDIVYSLGGGNVTLLGGDGSDVLGGDLGDDKLYGGNQDDILWASPGRDYVYGDAGNDTFDGTYLTTAMQASLLTNRGRYGGTNIAYLNGIENLTGSFFNDILQGNDGDNIINGGFGADAMAGGGGDDIYIVDDAGDIVSEQLNGIDQGGYDIIQTLISRTISNYVEELVLIGSDDISAIGDSRGNILIGNSGNNILAGNGGNDSMYGGAGDDRYIVDSFGDLVSEESLMPGHDDGGVDTVVTALDGYYLGAFIENLELSFGPTGGGNALDNSIIGSGQNNTLYGLGGNDAINGVTGADTMYGGSGNDTYTVDNVSDSVREDTVSGVDDGGTDTVISAVSYTLGAFVENLSLISAAAVTGTGNTLDNIIYGSYVANTLYGLSGNDGLDGAGGNDTMFGGAGDDTYAVSQAGDVVREDTVSGVDDGGTDTVIATFNYTLGVFLENLYLDGAAIVGTGNTLDNVITGEGQANTLRGLGGNDTLDGGTGGDRMFGGAGDDTYYVDDTSDIVSEVTSGGIDDGGSDVIRSGVNFTLPNFVERLELTGSDNISATGNAAINTISGNSGNNLITGGGGTDYLRGGDGADSFRFAPGGGLDYIYDFTSGTDKLLFAGADYGFAAGHVLTATEFRVNAGPVGTNAQFFYNPNNHLLYFDSNGTTAGGASAFVNMATPAASDFVFI